MADTPRVAVEAEIQLVRESLEGILEPKTATAVLFSALSTWDKGVPENADEVLEFVRGSLKALLHERIGPSAESALERLEQQLLQIAAGEDDLSVEIDLDEGADEEDAMTVVTKAVSLPVSVLVLAGDSEFALRLTASIGLDRVHAYTVADVAELRHATFSENPLLVVVNAAHPPEEHPAHVASAIRGLPDATLAVVWGQETSYGREVQAHIEQLGSDALFLDRDEGIEPLLDLVLSRFKPPNVPAPEL